MASGRTSELKNPPWRSVAFRYGFAVLLIGTVLTVSVVAHLGTSHPRFVPLFLLLAVAITFWRVGTRPGLLALVVLCLGTAVLTRNHFLAPGFPLAEFVAFFVILGLLELRFRERANELHNTDKKLQEIQAESLLMSRELQESKARLEEAQRVAHVGYFIWDLKTDRVIWSDETFRIFGLKPQDEPIDLARVRELMHPEDREFVFRTAEEAIRSGMQVDCEHRIFRPTGEMRVVHSLGDLKKDSSGQPYQMFGTTQDVTDRKRAEEALERSQFYLSEGQRLAHIGSWAANFATGQNFHVSDETVRMHGFDPSEGAIPLERYFNTVHAEDQSAVRAALENAIRTGADYDIEYRVCRANDGSTRFLRSLGHHNPSGEIGHYVGTTMDITEQKHAEQERERLRQLEADLAHTNRVNMLGELAAALAHEIKQPIAASITSASACLRWLAHDPPDLERARAAATRIEEDGNRAADVINRLRSFYKKGAPPERKMLDVKDIVQEMTVLLRNEAVQHSITIRSEFDANMPNIPGDRVQLQQVFMNLMLNAIEAMKDTGGELTIRSGQNPDGELLISISDTGVGLPPGNAERIFDAFHTTKPQGTGMGLAITRSIVESHGGRIWATANQEAGATFHFTLPREAEAHA